MQPDWKTLGPEGLTFFGRMCASVSHELKNSLAMINENAGLIGDLLMMAGRGKPLDPDMLNTASGRIAKHVAKADGIIGNLNRFAHLADHPVERVELAEHVALCVALHMRLASQRQVELAFEGGAEAVELRTRPFLLANAVHVCLAMALDTAAQGRIELRLAAAPEGASIYFSGLAAGAPAPAGQAEELFAALGAHATCDGGDLVLTVPDLPASNDD